MSNPDATPQLALLLDLLRRQLALIVLVTVAGTALAVVLGLRAPVLYTAKTLVAIERPTPESVTLEQPPPAEPIDAAFMREEMKLLTSHEHARLTVEALQLVQDPEFQPGPPSLLGRLRQETLAWLRHEWAAFTGVPGTAEPAPAVDPEAVAVRIFRQRLSVAVEDDSRVIAVSFTSADPAKAARIADAVADLHLQRQLIRKRAEAARTAAWIGQRLTGLEAEVKRDDAAVQSYRAEHGLAPTGGTDVVDQQVVDISRELVAARGELAQRQASLAFARELRGRGAGAESLPEVMGSPLIAELRRQEAELSRTEAELALTYGERHPRLRLIRSEKEELLGTIRREVGRIIANLEVETRTAQARVETLQAELDTVLGARNRNREAEVRLEELERKAEANRRLYELFLQRSKELEERETIIEPDARILATAAVPTGPSTPGVPMFAVLGLITSALAGGLLALLRDRLDDRLRGPGQVRAALGLPCIALVPRLDGRRLRRKQGSDELLGSYVEAMRSILAAMHLTGEGSPRMVLVASALPGEGRTTLAASLAAYAARLGRRVLLINLDTRRGHARGDEVGLVDRLLGDLPFEDLIRRDDALRVDFISSGRQRGDLMALVLNGQLRELLWRLGGCYDLVVIDSPPVLGAADARMLAPIVDRVLFVVRSSMTPRGLARAALQMLAEVRANLAGVVLTQAEIPWHARTGHGEGGAFEERRPKSTFAPPAALSSGLLARLGDALRRAGMPRRSAVGSS